MNGQKIIVIVLTAGLVGVACGLHFETAGDKPMNWRNYEDWPGIMPVINHASRFHHSWTNGNEHFYYQGDTGTLNDVLAKFADIEAKTHEIIIRPGPGQTKTSDGKVIKCDWLLHIVGGISKHLTTLDKGAMIWSKYPQITVYVGDGEIELDKIQLPKEVTVVEIDELSKRYAEALDSSDKTVRGWGCHRLAGLDPYSKKNVAVITKLLDDEDDWVHLNAIGALAGLGKTAASALPKMKELSKDCNERLRKKIEEAVRKITDGEQTISAADEKKHQNTLAEIRKFVRIHRKSRAGEAEGKAGKK
jgi:hypothetical protein